MNGSFSVRRIGLVWALAVLGFAGPLPAARAGEFRASGTWAITIEGSHLEGTRSGRARPGGPFTGVFSGKWVNDSGVGVGMLDFGQGDTLTYEWQVDFDEETGLLLGTGVVTGGTGKFAGASGTWSSIGVPAGDGTGTFEYDGTLSH